MLLIHYEVTQEENSLRDNMKTHIYRKKKKRIYIENPSAVVRVKWFIRHILTFIRDLFSKQENIKERF